MEETVKFIDDYERKKKIKKLLAGGHEWLCSCGTAYKDLPQEPYDRGHGMGTIDMCRCGSDLFMKLKDVSCKTIKVAPVRGILVFKEHHFKYCKCDKGEVWTGDKATECEMNLKIIGKKPGVKTYRCLESGLRIVIIKSTKKELESPDEVGSAFQRYPELEDE